MTSLLGSIILTGSTSALFGNFGQINYVASKGGVEAMTKTAARELARYNIRVNCIAPGGVEHKQGKDFVKKYSKHTPMKRMMKKNELNGLIEFLATEKSSYATGATFTIDGGWTAW